jgi:transposase
LQTTSAPPQSRHAKKKARAHAKAQRQRDDEQQRLQALPITRPHAAGIDIGGRSHWVCVGFTADASRSPLVREFPSHTDGLLQIVTYLREHPVTAVALEATGVYWIALLEILQQEKFDVLLVDPSYTKQLRGRPKTDRKDAQWIYRLHSVGLLPAAFGPDEAIAALRSYVRHRSMTVHQAGQCIQGMQKALSADEPQADHRTRRHHRADRAAHHPGHPARQARPAQAGAAPPPPLPPQRAGDRPGSARQLPRRACLRLAVGLRG